MNEETNCQKCLNKITVRNFVTLATISVFLGIVVYIVAYDSQITENPVLMFILGAFMSAVTMIYTFYYRKNQLIIKNKFPYNVNPDDFDICPCCGQKFGSQP